MVPEARAPQGRFEGGRQRLGGLSTGYTGLKVMLAGRKVAPDAF